MDKKSLLVTIILGIVFPVFVLITSLELAVFNKEFFLNELNNNNVSTTTGIISSEFSEMTDQIFAFLKGERADFDIYAEKENDRYVPLFTQDEMTHMDDVRGLFQIVLWIQAICGILFAAALVLLMFWNRSGIARGIFWGSIGGLIILMLIGIAACFDFTEVFVKMHELIFTNDLWYLDPAESVLINIVPEPYFIKLALRILIYATSIFLICTVAFGLLSKKLVSKTFSKNSKRKF
ncbi:MAG: TIGR01906 family membrane protein [Eubacterium sp.]